eukprot:scaffold2193_cov171-Amphora_coffeaeformis.AAC.1
MPSQFDSLVTTALLISVVFLVIRLVPSFLSLFERGLEKNLLVELYEWYTEKLSLPWQLIIGFMAFNLIVGLAGVDGRNPYSQPMGWMVESERNKQEFVKKHVDPLGHGDNKEKTKAS